MLKQPLLAKTRSLATLIGLLLVLALALTACAPQGLPSTAKVEQEGAAAPAPAQAEQPTQAEQAAAPAEEPAQPPAGEAIAADDPRSKGSADAPITIIEYSDFQCPYCSRWIQQTYPTLLKEYVDTGKARLVFRDFPLSMHPNADDAAVASRCAAEQGAYWPMHDQLFAAQAEWSNLAAPAETFSAYAASLGLDKEAFSQCLGSGKYDQAIQADMQEGMAAGIGGTPSFMINGQMFVGAQPVDRFRLALDTVLSGGSIEEEQAQAQPTQAPAKPVDIPLKDAPLKGDPNAPLTIVEYSDYQCPYCSRFFDQTLPELLQQYVDTGAAKLVFKDFPLGQIHPQAQKAAEAARCVRELAGSDDAYWAMHDKLFAGQEAWSGQENAADTFAGYAQEIGVNQADFTACLSSDRHAKAVEADLQEGLAFGVRGTPTFFINGQSFVGAQPLANFQQAIAMVQAGGNIQPPAQPTPTPQPTPAPLTQDIPLEDAAGVKGDPNAPVTIVEYSDYQCPFCQRHFAQTIPELQKYIDAGQVKYVFKDFPLTQIHPQAPKAAQAARCAGEQEAYWQMHDKLFQTQQEWSGQADAPERFKRYAGELGLDEAAFGACLDSGKFQAIIDANQQEGIGFGVRGTPGFFINRVPLFGAYPFQQFQAIIESELQ